MPKRTLDDAAHFLSALTREADGYRVPTVFQAYDDRPEKRPRLARVLIGTLSAMADTLLRLEGLGACICTTVQETNLRGRRTEDIVALRAAFTDADGPASKAPVLPPSMVVASRAGDHTYWLLHHGEPMDLFSRVQHRLAGHYRTDPAVHDLPRVMRLPGFLHQKGEPFLVRLRSCEPARAYHLRELLEAHGGIAADPAHIHAPCTRLPYHQADFDAWVERKSVKPGARNHTAYVIAAEALGRGFSVEQMASVVMAYCDRAGIPTEAPDVIRSALRRHARCPFCRATRFPGE